MIKVEGENSIVRDPYSKALLTVDTTALTEHRKRRQFLLDMQKNSERINSISSEIDSLKSDMNDIKTLLHQLLTANK